MNKPLLILYGSVTGNAEYCAEETANAARQRGYDPTLENMASTDIALLRMFRHVLILTSTYGEGDPPDGCEEFVEAVKAAQEPLENLDFAVFALGDSAYEYFCKCGRDVDDGLFRAGAQRLLPIVECDVEFQEELEKWIIEALDALAFERVLQS